MQLFDEQTQSRLQAAIGKEPIHYIGLGMHDFQFSSGNLVRAINRLRVDFCLQGREYTWESGPCAVPVWLLISQIPTGVLLESRTMLRINFQSGDWLRLHTEESPYENQIFEWSGIQPGAHSLDIY